MRNAKFAMAVCAAMLGTSTALGQGTVELRIVKVDNSGNPAGVTNDTGSEDIAPNASFNEVFYVQARQVGDMDANGISAFDIQLSSNAAGTFSAVGLSFTEQGVVFPGSDFVDSMDNGMFENFRATIQADNSNPGNGGSGSGVLTEVPTGDSLNLLPLDLAQGGRGEGMGDWINVYKFRYEIADAGAENVVLSADGGQAGYWANDLLIQPVDVADGAYTLVIPAPGAVALLSLGGLAAVRRRR